MNLKNRSFRRNLSRRVTRAARTPWAVAGMAIAVASGALMLAGCGSSHSTALVTAPDSTSVAAEKGSATITIAWPTRAASAPAASAATSRLIPLATNSIAVSFVQNGAVTAQQIIARPATGSTTTTASFAGLTPGVYSVLVTAFASTNGLGVGLAGASTTATIVSAQTTTVGISLVSTIDHLNVALPGATFPVASINSLTYSAVDASGNLVPLTPSALTFASSNTAIATVSSTGVVTAVGAGAATITVTDSESGVASAVSITVQAALPKIVYQNDFEGVVGQEWSQTTTEVTPLGARRFLGRFGPGPVSLSLANLPTHKNITISFKLFIIRSWDGNLVTNVYGVPVGPDLWSLSLDNSTLLHTTFGNWEAGSTTDTVLQSYPSAFRSGAFPSRTGASENNTLGYPSFQPPYPGPVQDSVYDLTFTVAHNAKTATFVFTGGENQDITDESWGIDDVLVSVSGS